MPMPMAMSVSTSIPRSTPNWTPTCNSIVRGRQVTIYPLHVRTGAAPTAEMPAPTSSMPVPKGSRILPALTDEAARQLGDADVISMGYPPRPDASTSPEDYSKWLDLVSRPITLGPATVGESFPTFRTKLSMPSRPLHFLQLERLRSAEHAGQLRRRYGRVAGASGRLGRAGPNHLVGFLGRARWPWPNRSRGRPGPNRISSKFPVFSSLIEFATYYTWTELLPNQPSSSSSAWPSILWMNVMVTVWVGDSRERSLLMAPMLGFISITGPRTRRHN